jgi:hypothetical protein
MAFLPALLILSGEELTHKLSKVALDVIEFSEETGQDHFAFHVDLILPEFARLQDCEPTLEYKNLLSSLTRFYEGKQLKLNIHVMGEVDESLEVLEWIIQTYDGTPVYGEIYVHNSSYQKSKPFVHHAWIVGEWHNKNEWTANSDLETSEVLLMTVNAGKSGQPEDIAKKTESFILADKYPLSTFVLDGGWKIEEDPLELNRQIVINSHYWNTK